MHILLKLFLAFIFWCGWTFFCILTAALLGGGPNADQANVRVMSVVMSLIPLILYVIYKIVRVYFLHNDALYQEEELFLIVVPGILSAMYVYSAY